MTYEEAMVLTPGTILRTTGVNLSSPSIEMLRAHEQGLPITFKSFDQEDGYVIATIEGDRTIWQYHIRDVEHESTEDDRFLSSLY